MNETQDQKQLNTWQDVVQVQIDRNTYPRINWKAIIRNKSTGRGISLTAWCARFQEAGLTAEQTLNTLILEYPELTEEARRRAWIGICARFGEHKTHIREHEKVKA